MKRDLSIDVNDPTEIKHLEMEFDTIPCNSYTYPSKAGIREEFLH